MLSHVFLSNYLLFSRPNPHYGVDQKEWLLPVLSNKWTDYSSSQSIHFNFMYYIIDYHDASGLHYFCVVLFIAMLVPLQLTPLTLV